MTADNKPALTTAQLEFFQEGIWRPAEALISLHFYQKLKKLKNGESALIDDDDKEEVFVRLSLKKK